MRMEGLSFDNVPAIHIPFRFFNTAPWMGALAACILIFSGPGVFISQWSPQLLAMTHLLTLGFMVMIMFGALFQLLPVISGITIPKARIVAPFVHSALLLGIFLLVLGFLNSQYLLFIYALPILALAVLVFLIALGARLRHQIRGGNTIFVEFSDYVMAVDAFGFGLDERIERFRELVPNKPIKYVSISHHHHDHMEQVSFYAKQDVTIITAKEFIPLLNKRISDVYPDKSVKPIFDIVTQKAEYADETQRVEIYEMKNMLHAETMLMTYFPAEQLIYLPDHYEDMYLIENNQPIRLLLAEIERLGLKVKGFIQAHGNEIFSLEKVKAAVVHPIKMKDFRRQPHQSVTHTE